MRCPLRNGLVVQDYKEHHFQEFLCLTRGARDYREYTPPFA